jgi:hypothetical protein
MAEFDETGAHGLAEKRTVFTLSGLSAFCKILVEFLHITFSYEVDLKRGRDVTVAQSAHVEGALGDRHTGNISEAVPPPHIQLCVCVCVCVWT